MAESEVLHSMVRSFRMSELQNLMAFAGKSKSGRKSELQARALDLVNVNSAEIKLKIRELSHAMYSSLGSAASVNPYSANYSGEVGRSLGSASQEPERSASPVNLSTESGHGGGRTRRSAAVAAARAMSRVSDISPAESDQSSNGSDYSDSQSSSASAASVVQTDSPPSLARGSRTSPSGMGASSLSFAGQIQPVRNRGKSNTNGPTTQNSIPMSQPLGLMPSSRISPGRSVKDPSEEPNSHLMYPTFPDVKLRQLPFFKVMATLMQPCALQPGSTARFQEQKLSFHLSPSQASEIASSSFRDSLGRVEYKKQIQMRFSLLETSCEQDDNFPASICVKVNNKMQPLPNPIPTNKPGVEPKRPPKPINITALCKLSSTMANYLDVSWAVEIGRGFTVSIYYVDKLSSLDLMKDLKERGIRHPDYTRAVIKEKLNDKDVDVMTTSCKVTLACPLGKMRMSYPCRASTCDHLQCFDANLFLMMNERKPKWLCPVCNKGALFDNLQIDGFFNEVLKSAKLPAHDHEVVLHNDGSWEPLPYKKEGVSSSDREPTPPPSAKIEKVETLNVEDDEVPIPIPPPAVNNGHSDLGSLPGVSPKTKNDKRSFDCITLDSDSDDEGPETRPPNRKRATAGETSSVPSRPTYTAPPGSPPVICLED